MVTLCILLLCEPPSPGLDPVWATASCCHQLLPSAAFPLPALPQPPVRGVCSCSTPCGAAGGSWAPFHASPGSVMGMGEGALVLWGHPHHTTTKPLTFPFALPRHSMPFVPTEINSPRWVCLSAFPALLPKQRLLCPSNLHCAAAAALPGG